MIVDALANTDVYIEKKQPLSITGNNLQNNNGFLQIDDVGNPLISKIDSGYTPLFSLTKYNGRDSLLLYNQTTKQIQLVKQGDEIKVDIDFIYGTQYFLEAKRVIANIHNGNIFTVDLTGYNIFKVYLDNGLELTNYYYNNGELIIRGLESNIIDDFSELVLFVYKDTSVTEVTDLKVSRDENNSSPVLNLESSKRGNLEFEISYYNYDTIYSSTDFIDGTYFGNEFIGTEIVCFDRLSISETLEKDTTKNKFRISEKFITKRIDTTCEIEIFDTRELVDMVQYIGRDEFRVVLVNPVFGRIFLINNCYMNNGNTIVFQKEKNTKSFKLSCGNYIDIKMSDPSVYGKGKYGKGQYGSGTWIINSYRKEV